jgi:hypothetical protein
VKDYVFTKKWRIKVSLPYNIETVFGFFDSIFVKNTKDEMVQRFIKDCKDNMSVVAELKIYLQIQYFTAKRIDT